jgi:sugar phosphate isomerase/epimerase
MKIGIDSYCYHRFFGEVYPQQQKPASQMTLEGFIKRAKELQVDGVSLESCFMPRFDAAYLSEIKGMLDESKLDRVFAWGHPDGLEGGKNEQAFDDMVRSIEYASAIGAKVMRVCGGSLQIRHEPHGPMLEKLTRMFSAAVQTAAQYDVKIADENHIDFNADEMLGLIQNVNSPIRPTLGLTSTRATSCVCSTTRSRGWKSWRNTPSPRT